MKSIVSPAYAQSLRFALFVQIVSIVLTGFVDDDGSFLPVVAAGWITFWIGVFTLIRFRVKPGKAELLTVRWGPLAVFVSVFTAGQYL